MGYRVNDRVIVNPGTFGQWGGTVVRIDPDGKYGVASVADDGRPARDSVAVIHGAFLAPWPVPTRPEIGIRAPRA